MDEELKAMLVALGPGGTRELAERALVVAHAYRDHAVQAAGTVLERWELGGTAEVCERLGVGKAWLGHVIAGRRPTPAVTTPVPLVTLSATPVWDMADWDEWAERHALLLEPRKSEADPFADA